MSPTLQIRLFGEFSLTDGDCAISGISSGRSQALLAYLVLNRHSPQPRQRIAFHLWADSTDTQARTNLRKELSNLRHALPQADSYLLVDAKTIQWQPTAAFELDVIEFEKALKTAEQSAADSMRVRSSLEQALLLYRGDLLPRCEDEWVLPERERLEQLRVRAFEQLIDLLVQQRDCRAALGYAQQLLRVDSLNEATYCTLMRLYALSGDRANALQTYHRCMTMLREELGIDPSAATQTLYQQILSEDGQTVPVDVAPVPIPTPTLLHRNWEEVNISWGEATDASVFYGRETELQTLERWIVQDHCRLVLLLGMGGIGKTTLAVKLAQQIQDRFEYVIWRSLRNAPPLATLLADLVPFLSQQQDITAEVGRLLHWLKTHRCLVVLDNLETIFQEGDCAGQYRPGYEAYGSLLKGLGEVPHQSCVILTSREKPSEITTLEGMEAVQLLHLSGSSQTAQALIETRGLFGSALEKQTLVEQYGYNPLALKIVASSIHDLFDGNIQQFLQQNLLLFNGIRRLLEEQFERLSSLERTIMVWLAINREWTSIAELIDDIVPKVARMRLLEALESLRWRSLIEVSSQGYTQQPVVMEYVTDWLAEQIATEITDKDIVYLGSYALLKTTAKDYVRETQSHLILGAIAIKLFAVFGTLAKLEKRLCEILTLLQSWKTAPLYAAGNLLNLCCHLKIDLTDYDFSNLTIRHAYLRKTNLHRVNFQNADFNKSIFSQMFGGVLSVAFSPDGQLLSTGDNQGQIHVWRVIDGQFLLALADISTNIYSVAWSPDGKILASGSGDHSIKLWHSETGRCLKTLQGHTNCILSLAWSPDGKTLASGSQDATVRCWDISTGQCLKSLNHAGAVWCVAWSPNSQILASGGSGEVIKLWNVSTDICLEKLQGHTDIVWAIEWHSNGQTLASSSSDQSIKLWDVSHLKTRSDSTGRCLRTLNGHTNWVMSIAWTPDGQFLVSGSADQTIRLWDSRDGQCLKILQGHKNWVWSVACSPLLERSSTQATASQKQFPFILASGADDEAVKLWSLQTGHCLRTLQGYRDYAWSISWHPNGRTLASGGAGQIVRIWDVDTRQCIKVLEGHTDWIYSVAYSPIAYSSKRTAPFEETGLLLASGSRDRTVTLWNVPDEEIQQKSKSRTFSTSWYQKNLQGHQDIIWCVAWNPISSLLAVGSTDSTIRLWATDIGQCIQTLEGHQSWVLDVTWSPDGQILASSSLDETIKFWNIQTGQCLNTLRGHDSQIWAVAWNPKQALVASGSFDKTIKLWNPNTGECLQTLYGHTAAIFSVTWSPDGNILASGSADHTVRLWDVESGNCLKTLQGHSNLVLSVSYSPAGDILASSSQDQTIMLWDAKTGERLKVLRADRPYEGMNITGATGLTEAQITTLEALGAIELDAASNPPLKPGSAHPLIGRDREWATIDCWLHSTAEVLLLLGEVGIGKTRLLEELARTIESDGGYVFWGRGFAAEMVRPYGAWIDGIRSIARDHHLSLPAALEFLLPQTDPIGNAPADRSSLFDAVVQWLAQLARNRSIVILLDDIQWLDEASIALLHYAVRLLSQSPVLFACAARPNELLMNESIAKVIQTLRRERRLQSLTLAPLDQEQTAALMHSIDPDFDRDSVSRVFAESGGNPLFILELARSRSQHEDGSIETLESLIQDRLLQLDEATRELLPWAAALGRSFNPNSLARLVDCNPLQLLTAMEQLEQQGIIRPGAVNGAMGYDFAHDIVRQVAYQQLSTPRRRLLHCQIAQTLQQDAIDDSSASDIAHHAAICGDHALATAASLAAAQRSLRLFAYAEAAELAQRGMQFCQQLDDRSRIHFHIHLLKVAVLAGVTGDRVVSLEADLHRLIAEANRLDLQEEEAIALEALIALHHDHGNLTGVHQHSLQAAERGRTASPTTTARMLAYTGWCLAEIERDMPRAEAMLLEARSLAARVGQDLLDVQSGLGIVRYYAADWEGARLHLEQAWQMAQATQDHWRTCLCLKYLAMLELEADSTSDALRYSHEMAIVAAQMDQTGSEGAIAAALTLLAQYQANDVDPAALEPILLTLHRLDDQRMLAYTLNCAATVDLQQNRVELAIDRAAAALAAARIVEHYSCLAIAWAILGQSLLAIRNAEQAIATLHRLRQEIGDRSVSVRADAAVKQFVQQLEPYLVQSGETDGDRPRGKSV